MISSHRASFTSIVLGCIAASAVLAGALGCAPPSKPVGRVEPSTVWALFVHGSEFALSHASEAGCVAADGKRGEVWRWDEVRTKVADLAGSQDSVLFILPATADEPRLGDVVEECEKAHLRHVIWPVLCKTGESRAN